ncbi:glycosyltransferase, partial [Escherichia coli]
MLFPVVLFVYNRADHTRQTIDALKNNILAPLTDLYIYSDFPKTNSDIQAVKEVRCLLHNINGFKSVTIIERDRNYGLGKSVIQGVTEILKRHDAVIVLEDDLVTHKDFLTYMNKMLELFHDDPEVFSISGYSLPNMRSIGTEDYYFVPRISSWGWGCWKDRWEDLDWDIKKYKQLISDKRACQLFNCAGNDMLDMLIHQVEGEAESWAIRFDYNRFIKGNLLTIYPRVSFIKNIGMDGSGVHGENTCKFDNEFDCKRFINVQGIEKKYNHDINPLVISEFKNVYKRKFKSIILI